MRSHWTARHTLDAFLLLLLASSHALGITTIPFPPTMIRQPPQEQLFQVAHTQDEPYRAFMLECEANGNPEPDYRWTKNGEDFDPSVQSRITQQPHSGTLIVNRPEDEDEGIYQCFAENIHGVAVSNAVFLRKSELNSFPDEDLKEVFVIEGEPLSVDCEPPSGYPKPTVFWVTQSKTGTLHTVNDTRISVDPDGNLHFSNVTQEDAVEDYHYACGVTSLFRNEYKFGNQIVLRVEPSGTPKNYPPTKQYVSPPNTVALRGHTLELHCIYGGTPVPEVKWSKKGGSLQSPRASSINFGKTLRIRKVDFQDEGTYECLATNGIGAPATHSMAVTVQAAPFWINVANNTNSAEEETVTFECVAGGIPTPEVQWYFNGVPLAEAEPNPRRKLDKSSNTLVIENLEKTDTGVFQCNASNVHGYAFRDFYLNVLALAPSFTERPEPITMAVKSSITTLRCRVFGAPNPKIKWLRDGQEVRGDRFQVLENGDLEITNVAVKDAGDYTCYAINKFGDTEAMGKLEVKERTKITQPPENFEVAAGKTAPFRCKAEFDETLVLTIEWLFDGKPVDSDLNPRAVQAADNSLTITRTEESDSGVYTCVAKTELDQDEATATLIVQDVPNPPEIIGVQCDKFMALVEWRPTGDRRAPILSYTIQYNTSFTPDKWEDAFVNIPAPDTRFKVSMTPWANYTFHVLAINKIGTSLPSNHSEVCTTPPDVPYKNPDKVVGKGTEKDNLVISWTAMAMIEQNAPGFFYKVFWKREDIPQASWNIEEIHDWEQNKLIIPDQPTFKPYRIKVEAHNERGQALTAATEIIGYSGEDVPLEAPKNFTRLYVQDARSAMFSWSPVSPESVRGHFRGYKIQTWTLDEGEERLREEIVKANVTQALVTIFRPYSRNLVRVLAYNDMYNGPPSDVIEFTTPEGTPGPVANFDAIPLGSSALYLIWKRPLEPNGILTGYTIYYNEVNGTDLGETQQREPPIRDPRETRTKLSGLKPKTKYRLTIHATTSIGEGDPYFIEVETNEQAERAPDEPDFVWSHLPDTDGKAGVRVTWVPAVEGHPGSHFYVQYRKKGDSQWESTPMEEDQDSILVTGLELGSLYEMKVVAVDGRFQKSSKVEEIETGGMAAVQAPEAGENFATAAWFIGMMCAIALLLLLLIIICLIKRNRGGKYSVHEKEAAQGRDLDYPEEGGFNEYAKPADTQKPAGGSQTSLSSSVKGPESETDSMVEYGEGEESKFTEDGSFIGQYGAKKQRDTTSPSALATFV